MLVPSFNLSRSSHHSSLMCAHPSPGLCGEELLTRQTKALYCTLQNRGDTTKLCLLPPPSSPLAQSLAMISFPLGPRGSVSASLPPTSTVFASPVSVIATVLLAQVVQCWLVGRWIATACLTSLSDFYNAIGKNT